MRYKPVDIDVLRDVTAREDQPIDPLQAGVSGQAAHEQADSRKGQLQAQLERYRR
jgi:hypothetical protein